VGAGGGRGRGTKIKTNVILNTRYISTCVGAGDERGRGTKIKTKANCCGACYLTCDMYKSSLRHTHDPVLSSLKIKGTRLLFTDNSVQGSNTQVTLHSRDDLITRAHKAQAPSHTDNYILCFGNVLEKLVVFFFWSGQEDVGIVPPIITVSPTGSQSQIHSVILQLLSPQYHCKFVCNFYDVDYRVQLAVNSVTTSIIEEQRMCYMGHKNHTHSLHVQLLYRVIQNDCRGFNNLPYTIHLRQEYVGAMMDQEILKVFFCDVRCAVDMHFSAWSAVY
jgi:hypothetical protein